RFAREPITLQPRRELLQRADAGGFGFVAPLLEAVEHAFGIASVALGQTREARAELAYGAQFRAAFDERGQALTRTLVEPAAAVGECATQLARQALEPVARLGDLAAQGRRDDTAEVVA